MGGWSFSEGAVDLFTKVDVGDGAASVRIIGVLDPDLRLYELHLHLSSYRFTELYTVPS